MIHHFADLLDRDKGYWTLIPNKERYAYRIGEVPAGSASVKIATIGKGDDNWPRVLTFPQLEELTLHEPTREQMLAVGKITRLNRLRITHARTPTLDFVKAFTRLEELVLEYVSGFSDLGPVGSLKRLRALHIENLRRVTDFSGLSGATSLKYLALYGTGDWQQPIDGWDFLYGLPALEVVALWQVVCRVQYPAMLPFLSLRKLKELRVHGSYFPVEEYALLEEGLPEIDGANWGPYRTVARSVIELPDHDIRSRLSPALLRLNHPEVRIMHDGRRMIDDPTSNWFEFTGRGAGRVKCSSKGAADRCREYSDRYLSLKEAARSLIVARGIR